MRTFLFFLAFPIALTVASSAQAQAQAQALQKLTACKAGAAIQKVQALDGLLQRGGNLYTQIANRQQGVTAERPGCANAKPGYNKKLGALRAETGRSLTGGVTEIEKLAKAVSEGMKTLGATECSQQVAELAAEHKNKVTQMENSQKALECL